MYWFLVLCIALVLIYVEQYWCLALALVIVLVLVLILALLFVFILNIDPGVRFAHTAVQNLVSCHDQGKTYQKAWGNSLC